ncbi:hypothetical protein OGAPHI_004084 [Ogataea philodendri]|uniref:Uncharacterized protein n=1 Tax=Ogataea philodendri TaxID=1378263 RepID=A0A9P8P623_9ASCO|nr:uncharacterized protein OGAPHI_004084 [Ogataea philodendri]KAH3665895.1 hypothetical protein OGAPHI_004084 [Ogataea philodendri]
MIQIGVAHIGVDKKLEPTNQDNKLLEVHVVENLFPVIKLPHKFIKFGFNLRDWVMVSEVSVGFFPLARKQMVIEKCKELISEKLKSHVLGQLLSRNRVVLFKHLEHGVWFFRHVFDQVFKCNRERFTAERRPNEIIDNVETVVFKFVNDGNVVVRIAQGGKDQQGQFVQFNRLAVIIVVLPRDGGCGKIRLGHQGTKSGQVTDVNHTFTDDTDQ